MWPWIFFELLALVFAEQNRYLPHNIKPIPMWKIKKYQWRATYVIVSNNMQHKQWNTLRDPSQMLALPTLNSASDYSFSCIRVKRQRISLLRATNTRWPFASHTGVPTPTIKWRILRGYLRSEVSLSYTYNLKNNEQKIRDWTYVIYKQAWTDPTRIHPTSVPRKSFKQVTKK